MTSAPTERQTHILLAGSSGFLGRAIRSSLSTLLSTDATIKITVLARTAASHLPSTSHPRLQQYNIPRYDDQPALVKALEHLQPDIIVSALKAEPTPVFDTLFVRAVQTYLDTNSSTRPVFYINGFTLDLLDPSVATVLAGADDGSRGRIADKTALTDELRRLSEQESRFRYCTVINAAFLDYVLIKGYTGIDIDARKAVLWDDGSKKLTGCSVVFVAEVVRALVQLYLSPDMGRRRDVTNRRLRVAEVEYSGAALLECVREITGDEFEVEHRAVEKAWDGGRGAMNVISYLNLSAASRASSLQDGLGWEAQGALKGKRRNLREICERSVREGVEVWEYTKA